MLDVKKLVKKFGETVAVNDVSFSVHPGEIFSLIGPNGSGKTTIVKTAVGLLQPTSGTIEANGFDVTKEAVNAKSVIGYIPDEPTVWAGMTGSEFLHFVGALYGMNEAARKAEIPKLLDVFSLQPMASGYFEDYSRGNKQKFAILAAMLHKPKILLIDEPIVGLDPESGTIAKREFKKFADGGGAVLLVTHTLSVAREIADRIGVLKNGRLVAVGSFEELAKKAKLDKKATLEDVYHALT